MTYFLKTPIAMTNTYHTLMSVVKQTLKRHDCFFNVVDGSTLYIDSFLNIPLVLSITSSSVNISGPLAFYETDEQCAAILEICKNSRTLWCDEWSYYINLQDSNAPQVIQSQLPDGLTFVNSYDDHRINASLFYERDYIIADPEALYSTVSVILRYRDALMDRLYPVLYDTMPKLYTEPMDPKSLFFCYLFLYCKNGTHCVMPIDFNDVRTSFRFSKHLVLYPKLKAESLKELALQMHKFLSEEIIPSEPFGLLMSVTVPNNTIFDGASYRFLREQFNTNHICINLLCSNDNKYPYEAEMVLLRLEDRK